MRRRPIVLLISTAVLAAFAVWAKSRAPRDWADLGWPRLLDAVRAVQGRWSTPADVSLPNGYRLERVLGGLTYPTELVFAPDGAMVVVEGGFSYGPAEAPARVLRIDASGQRQVVAEGFEGPLTGLAFRGEEMFVLSGGFPGRLWRVGPSGVKVEIVTGLPTGGDHYTTELALGPDDRLYFGVGSATNSGVVGADNWEFGWLGKRPELRDVPCRDLRLRNVNYIADNRLTPASNDQATTGPFQPFGTRVRSGAVARGALPCNGGVFSVRPDGSDLKLVGDGFRNPFGLRFDGRGQLWVIDQGYDARGSRPVAEAPDFLYAVKPGAWYGFPDFAGGVPLSDPRFAASGGRPPERLLQQPPPAEPAVFAFQPYSATMKFDFSTNPRFGFLGQLFAAQFGSLGAAAGGVTAGSGYRVVRVDLSSGQQADFLVNEKPGPEGQGPERPIAVRFSPGGSSLYVLDFGVIEVAPGAVIPRAESGAVWRVVPEELAAAEGNGFNWTLWALILAAMVLGWLAIRRRSA